MSGKSVEAKVICHKKDDKIIVFKKKRRKGYRVKNGHRQSITEILIQGISEKKASQKKEVESAKKTTTAKKTTAAKNKSATKK